MKNVKILIAAVITSDTTSFKFFGPITDSQTKETADYYREIKFDFVFSSDLKNQTIK